MDTLQAYYWFAEADREDKLLHFPSLQNPERFPGVEEAYGPNPFNARLTCTLLQNLGNERNQPLESYGRKVISH
jgi:hypothetical protein